MALTTLTALFATFGDAERALESIIAAGVPRAQTRLLGSIGGTDEDRSHGLLGTLKELFVPESDGTAYVEGMRGGRAMVTARVEDSEAARMSDILERHEPVDLTESFGGRETGWSTHNNPYLTHSDDASHGASLTASMVAGRSETDQAGVPPAGNPVVEGGEPGPNRGRVRRY